MPSPQSFNTAPAPDATAVLPAPVRPGSPVAAPQPSQDSVTNPLLSSVERNDLENRETASKLLPGNREVKFEDLISSRIAPNLRSLRDGITGLTSEQRNHFEDVLTRFEQSLGAQYRLEGDGNLGSSGYLAELIVNSPIASNKEEANAFERRIVEGYRTQLSNFTALIDGYSVRRTNDAQKLGLLVYAEYLTNLASGNPDLDAVNEGLIGIGIDTSVLTPLRDSLASIGTDVPPTFEGFVDPLMRNGSDALRVEDVTVTDNGITRTVERRFFDEASVDLYLIQRSKASCHASMNFVHALDSLETDADKKRYKKESEMGLFGMEAANVANPFRVGWAEKVSATHDGEFGKAVINSLLGDEKVAQAALGRFLQPSERHVKFSDISLYAPVRGPGQEKEEIKKIPGVRATVTVGLWSGEKKRLRELAPGETVVGSKDFFGSITEESALEITVDSADKAANILMQIEAAKVIDPRPGAFRNTPEEVSQAKFLSDLTPEEYKDAKAFMVPVIGRDGKPTYVVWRKGDLDRFYKDVRKVRDAFQELAVIDDRYKVTPWEERAKDFDLTPQLYETSYSTLRDELGAAANVNVIARERINRLGRERPPADEDSYVSNQIEDSLDAFLSSFADFEAGYCRYSHYEFEAKRRLVAEGLVADGSAAWKYRLEEMIKQVTLEYAEKARAFRALSKTISATTEPKALERMLSNMDYELEILTATGLRGKTTEVAARKAVNPFLRGREKYAYRTSALEDMHYAANSRLRAAIEVVSDEDRHAGFDRLANEALGIYMRSGLENVSSSVTSISNEPVEDAEKINATNAKKLLTLRDTLSKRAKNGLVSRSFGKNVSIAVSGIEHPENYEELISPDLSTNTNKEYGLARARFHSIFGRYPSDSEIQRFFESDNNLFRKRLKQITEMRASTALLEEMGPRLNEFRGLRGNPLAMYDTSHPEALIATASAVLPMFGVMSEPDLLEPYPETLLRQRRIREVRVPEIAELRDRIATGISRYASMIELESAPSTQEVSQIV